MVVPQLESILRRQGYYLIGNHSAVKVCYWTKEMLVNRRPCYKSTFYGIRSHRCIQMTPAVDHCTFSCLHCWRFQGFTNVGFEEDPDDPDFIVEESIKGQRALLSGYKGDPRVPRELFEEAYDPAHVAISLTGEPTLYPRLPELVRAYHRRGFTTFVVTNGSVPETIERLINEEEPTQLYISITAPNEELHRKINVPRIKDSWSRVNRSLELMSTMKARRTIRVTVIKGLNMDEKYVEEYAKLLEKADPDFIEVKAYMYMGYSRYRLKPENSPKHFEVKEFASKLANAMGYIVASEREDSRVVLLTKPERERRVKRFLELEY